MILAPARMGSAKGHWYKEPPLNAIFSWIDAIPAILRIALIFVLILFAIKRNWSLGNAFLAGSLGLGIVFGMEPLAIARSMGWALVDPKTLSLAVVVSLILVLSHTLEKSGQMARLLDGFKGLIQKPKVNLVIFPALIGLLPMPGGAIFSAPMVKNLGHGHRLSSAQLSYINYWFRHIWEYWWPLYPGILLTTALAGVDLWRLVLFTAPLTLIAVVAGYWPLRGSVAGPATSSSQKGVLPFLKELAPIAFVIVFGLSCGLLFSAVFPQGLLSIAKETGLILALLIALFWVWQANRVAWAARWAIVKNPAVVKMIYMVAAILIFKGILEDSQAVDQVSREMLRWHIPLLPITMLLPFLVGGVAGITIAFVGTTFPILISLIDTLGHHALMLPYLMLALASGFAGVLVSPLHLCFLLSNEYFRTTLMPVYKLMRVPLLALLIGAVAYFEVLCYWKG
jgi:integral membrane protein (TIGR00529 family)